MGFLIIILHWINYKYTTPYLVKAILETPHVCHKPFLLFTRVQQTDNHVSPIPSPSPFHKALSVRLLRPTSTEILIFVAFSL